MAYGRIAPFSRVPASLGGTVYPKIYNVGSGNGNWRMLGLGVAASLTADAWWELFFAGPLSIPTGQLKLELWSRANASSGVARVNPNWINVPMGSNPAALTHNAEGATSVTWTAPHVVMQTKFILDAAT